MDWGILDMSWHDLRRYDKDCHDLLIPDIRTDMIWEEVIWNLLVQELERKLKPNCLHVGLLQGGGDVHVHVEEPAHGAPLLRLLYLQLRQKLHEPLEVLLVAVDPVEINLKHGGLNMDF